MKKVVCILALVGVAVLLIPTAALAQDGEFYGGFAYGRFSEGTITIQPIGFVVEGTAYLNDNIGITGEFSWGRDADDVAGVVGASVDAILAMGGVRFRFPNDSVVTPSLRAVAGIGNTNVEACVLIFCADVSANAFTLGIGGALDFAVSDAVAIRVQPDLVFYDFEDALFRFTAGAVFGF